MKRNDPMEACRLVAARIATTEGLVMAIGYQQNDEGELVPGYCPLQAVGPAFVIDVREVAEGGTVRQATAAEKAMPGPVAAHLAAACWKRQRQPEAPSQITPYVFHEDGGHGWLQVPRAELTALNITAKISAYSYQSRDGQTAYLEEDCDLGLFMQAKGVLHLEDLPGGCRRQYHHREAPMRGMDRFESFDRTQDGENRLRLMERGL